MMWFGNKQNQKNYWKPGISFLRSQRTQVSLPNGVVLPLTWKFTEIGTGRLPFHYIHCKLKTRDFETTGQGYALSIVHAMRKALAEAWERLWLYLPKEFPDLALAEFASSNGFAAGPTAIDALTFAKDELVERSVVLTAWQSMRGWQTISPQSLTYHMLTSALHSEGWTSRLFRIEEKTFGTVLAALLSHPEKGFVFDSKAVGASSQRKCEANLIHSLFRVKYGQDNGEKGDFEFPESGYPEDQLRFYENPSVRDAFAFLDSPESQNGVIELPSPQLIKQQILCDSSSLPAVAVASHPEWPVLTWGKESIKGKNPWPQPLA